MKNRCYVTEFDDDHNHDLLSSNYFGLLRSHRQMGEGDVLNVNSMRRAGISSPKIYGFLAMQSGGFEKVGFGKKEIYNQIHRRRRLAGGDANAAIRYLHKRERLDPLMFWRHEVDAESRLR